MVLGNLVSPGLSPCGAWRVIRRSHVCKLGVGDKGRSERTVREKRAEDRERERLREKGGEQARNRIHVQARIAVVYSVRTRLSTKSQSWA